MQLTRSASHGNVPHKPPSGGLGLAGLPIGRRPASVLETLLKTARPSASQGFGLTDEFLTPSKVQRCVSAPLPFSPSSSDESNALSTPVCRGCRSLTATHSTGRDGCVSCDACGAVVEERRFVALGHDKAVRSDQDSTTRADTWQADEPDSADLETATAAFSRHTAEVGGTPLFAKTRKLGVARAISTVRRAAVSEYRTEIGWSSKLEARHRAVLVILVEILEAVEGVHERVAEICRRTLRTLLERNEKHVNVCRGIECCILVDQVPNALLASMVIRVAVERLEKQLGTPDWPLQGVEVTRATLLKVVDQAGFSSGRAGPLQVATARVAVERLLDKTMSTPQPCEKVFPAALGEEAEASSVSTIGSVDGITIAPPTPSTTTDTLEAMPPTPTPPLRIGVGVEKNMSTESLVDAAAEMSIFAIRNALWAVCQLTNASAIREHAFELLAVGPAADWARGVELGADEAACCLSLAIAQKMGRDTSSLDATLERVAKQNASSASVAREQVVKLLLILPDSLSGADATGIVNTSTTLTHDDNHNLEDGLL